MFGPTVQILKGQNVILCPGRGTRWISWLEEIFGAEEAVLTRMDGKQHDTFMAVTQGLTHLISVALGRTLQKLEMHPDEAMKLATQVFRLKLDLIGRLFALDIALYNSLMGKNPYVPHVLEVFWESLEEAYSKASDPDNQVGLDFLIGLKDIMEISGKKR
jgi:prephenate dehydrogenase